MPEQGKSKQTKAFAGLGGNYNRRVWDFGVIGARSEKDRAWTQDHSSTMAYLFVSGVRDTGHYGLGLPRWGAQKRVYGNGFATDNMALQGIPVCIELLSFPIFFFDALTTD